VTALLLAVLSASLLGSLHCVAMCGPFVAISVGPSVEGRALERPWKLQAAYHLGRFATYLTFGFAAGIIGASIDLGGSLIHIQRGATVLAAATLVLFGVVTLLRTLGLRNGARVSPGWMTRLAQRGHRAAWALTPLKRAMVIGLLTTLLPCGWLYAFVVTAAGTGHALMGVLVMAVFWVGTLPVMVGFGAGFRRIAGPLGAKAPVLTALLLVGVGVFTLAHRASLVGLSLPVAAQAQSAEASAVPNPHDTLPCCHGK
jgi:sulfite exporter TauE/SafE